MEEFDPYRKWLGIPPHEQPPNYYRLLGLPLFESDRDVIANAADRQMAHLRTFQGGKNSAVSQKILNEVAAARICLMNPQKREEYNARLRAETAVQIPPVAPPVVATVSMPVAKPPVIVEQPAEEFPEIIKFPSRMLPPTTPYHHSHHRKNRRWQGRMVTLIFAGVGVLFAVWYISVVVGDKFFNPNVNKPAEKPKAAAPEKTSPKSTKKNPPVAEKHEPVTEKKPTSKVNPPQAAKPPANSAADNEMIGKVLCFRKGQWSEGLPKLAESGNEELKNLAQKELGSPESVADRLAVADGWWSVSEKYAPPDNKQIRQHAVEWYKKVVGELEESEHDRAEWRISQESPTPRGEKPPVDPDKLE